MKAFKQKKCKICRELFTPHYSSFQKTCGISCAKAEGKQIVEKERAKAWAVEKKERSDKIKKHGEYEGELQTQINLLCRVLSKDVPCTACGGYGKMSASHRFNVNDNNTWRFNLHNLEPGCYRCNDRKSGNLDGYDDGLMKIYGQEYYEYVRFGMKLAYPIIKLTKEELIEARRITMQIIKELQKIDMVYPPMVRIRMKDEFNARIGIYTKPFKETK